MAPFIPSPIPLCSQPIPLRSQPEPASDHASLTFHALAFVPLGGARTEPVVAAASLLRPSWVTFASETFYSAAVTAAAADGPLVGALTKTSNVALGLQRFATLHASISRFLQSIRRPLSDLSSSDVEDADDLATLAGLPQAPIELFRGALGLTARAFAEVHRDLLLPFEVRLAKALAPGWALACAEAPALGAMKVRVSSALGPRGRLARETIFVGTGSLPNEAGDLDIETPLAIAVHEAAVAAAQSALFDRRLPATWATVERVALDAAEGAFAGSSVGEALARWRAGLFLGNLAPRSAELAACAKAAALALRSR